MEETLTEAVAHASMKAGLNVELTSKQQDCLRALIENNDVFGVLPTGYGKTTIYGLVPHIFEYMGDANAMVLVISPLISLMKDQMLNLEKLNVKSAYVGDSNMEGCITFFY